MLVIKADLNDIRRKAVERFLGRMDECRVSMLDETHMQNIIDDMLTGIVELAMLIKAVSPHDSGRIHFTSTMEQTTAMVIDNYAVLTNAIVHDEFSLASAKTH